MSFWLLAQIAVYDEIGLRRVSRIRGTLLKNHRNRRQFLLTLSTCFEKAVSEARRTKAIPMCSYYWLKCVIDFANFGLRYFKYASLND